MKEIETIQEDGFLYVDGICFNILNDLRDSYILADSNNKMMCVRKVPLNFRNEWLTNKEINFLQISLNKKFIRPGARKIEKRDKDS